MTDDPQKTAPHCWDLAPVIAWLLKEGRFLPDLGELMRQLGGKMLAAGAPVWRLRLSMRTLHPLTTGVSSVWEREGDATTQLQSPHGLEGRSGYIGSPMEIINRTAAPFRKRLTEPLSDTDHSVLHDLKARGGTDYFGTPLRFSVETAAILVVNTDAAGGFADQDIRLFSELASVLAPIVEVYNLRQLSLAIAEAYLGPRTGQRVLQGQITRGHIDTIDAAIFVSDIRDWTGINNRLAPQEALALANKYFEVVAGAVETHGGEVLKLMGDGILAVFPTDADGPDPVAVCERALAAAHDALAAANASGLFDELGFGVGMHYGEVLYGNVGSKTRIDFTVLGQAVNVAARIEGLCGTLDIPVLFSQAFADRIEGPTRVVAQEVLRGLDRPTDVLTTG